MKVDTKQLEIAITEGITNFIDWWTDASEGEYVPRFNELYYMTKEILKECIAHQDTIIDN